MPPDDGRSFPLGSRRGRPPGSVDAIVRAGASPDGVQPEAKGGLIPLCLGMVILLNSGPRAAFLAAWALPRWRDHFIDRPVCLRQRFCRFFSRQNELAAV